MGTRNLTMVISNKKTKVAQYGQFDGYPEGQGMTILNFLRRVNFKKFKTKVDGLRFATPEDEKELNDFLKSIGSENGWLNMEQAAKYNEKYGWLARETAGQILTAVMGNPIRELDFPTNKRVGKKYKVRFLQDGSKFAADSLFCEWAYVIDLDKGTFEVYKGFNKKPLGKDQRFRYMQDLNLHLDKDKDGNFQPANYYPVRHLVTFKLKDLPNKETFLRKCLGEKEYAERLADKKERAKKRRETKRVTV